MSLAAYDDVVETLPSDRADQPCRGIETHVIHSTSVAVSREKRRAKTDRVDAEMLLRVFLGWLRGERDHCSMVAVPTIEAEDDRRPGREREALVAERTSRITIAHPRPQATPDEVLGRDNPKLL